MKIFLLFLFLISGSRTRINSQTVNNVLSQTAEGRDLLRKLFHADLEYCKRFDYDNVPSGASFDFIVIGAGSTGSVVAGRLSENPNWQILLLEAGKTNTVFHDIPIEALNHDQPSAFWGYQSVPQKFSCFGMNNRQCSLFRGKVLGGTGAINHMKYSRGNSYDYDRWKKNGSSGWSYKEVLPYFIKSEHNLIKSLRNSPYHGQMGPIYVEADIVSKYADQFLKAAVEAGHYLNPDYNGRSQIGVSYFQKNTVKGHRHNSYRAFIESNLGRPNLHVRPSAQVTKILIDPITNEAYGVEFVYKNSTRIVYSKKEVILSAGAFNSPHLLMLSGIGPANILTKYDIPIIKNLPVGKHLSDHLYFLATLFTTNITEPINQKITIEDVKLFLKSKNSPLSFLSPTAVLFTKAQKSEIPSTVPDTEIVFQMGSLDETTSNIFNIKSEIFENYFQPITNKVHMNIGIILLNPKSEGTVELVSSNPFILPKVNPKYLNNKEDMETIIKGIKIMLSIVKQPEFQKIDAQLYEQPIPGCESYPFASNNYWRCAIATLSTTGCHFTGTCRMGDENDRNTVVNPELKVHGINRLRVADASIMPRIPAGHTNAACYMIGEKVSDMIKEQWWY